MTITISTTVSKELHEKAKRADLKWSHALRFGIIKLLRIEAGEDLAETNRNINELRKDMLDRNKYITNQTEKIRELQTELDALKEAQK